MFYIVASDLDGTLLTPNYKLTPFTRKILKLLTGLSVHFIVATGRHYTNVVSIRNNLGIYDYLITSNGARIYDAYDRLIAAFDLDIDIVCDLLNIVNDNEKIAISIFQEDIWLISKCYINQLYLLRNSFLNSSKICKKNFFSLDGISKVLFTSKNYQQLLFLEKKINARWGNNVNVSFSFPTCLEVMPRGTSKGHALEIVANLLGYQLKDCISFGDGMNDQEMLAMAGKGCIMYNAQQRLKQALPYLEIIGSNFYESVPFYLKKMYFY